MVHAANEKPGEAWLQVHPAYHYLAGAMITHAEERLADVVGFVNLMVPSAGEWEAVASQRGYRRLGPERTYSERLLTPAAAGSLPSGYRLITVADEDDVEKRRRAKALAFGTGYAPSAWPPASAFREMQRAPDYRQELDWVVVAPDGEYAAFCTIWLDPVNQYANLEPVGTHPEHRRLGLARGMLEAIRMADATRSFMFSTHPLYQQLGFRPTPWSISSWIRYFPAGGKA